MDTLPVLLPLALLLLLCPLLMLFMHRGPGHDAEEHAELLRLRAAAAAKGERAAAVDHQAR